MEIIRVGSGTTWEDQVGYCRAVRYDKVIEVSGTTASDGEKIFHVGDAGQQTRYIFEKIEKAIIALGGTLEGVIRTRMYVTDIAHFEAIGQVHGEFFSAIRPASTLVEVSKFVHPDILVEIEVTAVVQ